MHLKVLKEFLHSAAISTPCMCVRVVPNRFRYISSNFVINHNIFAVYYFILIANKKKNDF